MINSFLNNDLYTFTVGQVAWKYFPNVKTRFRFYCRTEGINFKPLIEPIKRKIKKWTEECVLTSDEYDWLSNLKGKEGIPFFQKGYMVYLSDMKLRYDSVKINLTDDGGLDLTIDDMWTKAIMYEVPLLQIIQETYFENKMNGRGMEIESSFIEQLKYKCEYDLPIGFECADFGTRRARSAEWHGTVLLELMKAYPNNLVGTSNCYWAKEYGLRPIGTMSHQYFMILQRLFKLDESQKKALDIWAELYDGALGIALSDTYGRNPFFEDLTLRLAKQFDGIRHDSGCPDELTKDYIDLLNSYFIDPKTKSVVFSDGLNFKKAIEIFNKWSDIIKVSFGIGTWLTCDSGHPTIKPLSNVIKADAIWDEKKKKWLPLTKLSDNSVKVTGIDREWNKHVAKEFDHPYAKVNTSNVSELKKMMTHLNEDELKEFLKYTEHISNILNKDGE